MEGKETAWRRGTKVSVARDFWVLYHTPSTQRSRHGGARIGSFFDGSPPSFSHYSFFKLAFLVLFTLPLVRAASSSRALCAKTVRRNLDTLSSLVLLRAHSGKVINPEGVVGGDDGGPVMEAREICFG